MVFYGSSWEDFTDTGRSTGAYILFYWGVPIDHFTHVPGPVAQSIADIESNSLHTVEMALAHFKTLNNELLKKDPDVVPEQAPLVIFDRKSAIGMATNGKDAKHTRHISRRIYFQEMVKIAICTRQCVVRDVWNWYTLEPRMLGKMD